MTHKFNHHLGRNVCALVVVLCYAGCADQDATQPSKQALLKKAVLYQLHFHENAKLLEGFEEQLESAKKLVVDHGLPDKPFLFCATYVRRNSSSRQGLLNLLFLSEDRDIKGIELRVVPRTSSVAGYKTFSCVLENARDFAAGCDHVAIFQQPMDLHDGPDISSTTEKTQVDLTISFDSGMSAEKVNGDGLAKALANASVEETVKDQTVLLIPEGLLQSHDVHVRILDSNDGLSNELKIREWIRE